LHRTARDQSTHAVRDDVDAGRLIVAQPRGECRRELIEIHAPVIVVHGHREAGRAQSQLQCEIAEGNRAQRRQAFRIGQPQARQRAADKILRIKPQQSRRLAGCAPHAEL
jgi:hypothetical protein